jgi:hypothetical protein
MLPLVFVSLFFVFACASLGENRRDIAAWKGSLLKRDLKPTCSCSETPSEFQSDSSFVEAASEPSGYVTTFTNGQSWPSGGAWLGYTDIDEYNTTICAALCDVSEGCSSFAICMFLDGIQDVADAVDRL